MDIDAIKKMSRTSAQQVYEPVKPAPHKKMAEVRASLFKDTEPVGKESATGEKIETVASEVQIMLKRLNTELRFDVDNKSRETIVRIVDVDTGDVVRQIPSEDLLALRERMDDLIGVLYKAKV